MNKKFKFGPASQVDEDCETLLSDSEKLAGNKKLHRRTLSWWAIALLLFASFCLSAFIGAWLGTRWPLNADSFCTRQVSQYCKYCLEDVETVLVVAETPSLQPHF
jgi:hypothetical protein